MVGNLFKILPHVLFKEDEVYRNMSDNKDNIDVEIEVLENEYKKVGILQLVHDFDFSKVERSFSNKLRKT